jgi:hypothetical protein
MTVANNKAGSHVTVVGGGIIGISCAYYLRRAGYQVTVIDQSTIGSGCSHGNCGLICPSDLMPLASPGAIRQTLKMMWQRRSPFRIKPTLSPTLWLWFFKLAMPPIATHSKLKKPQPQRRTQRRFNSKRTSPLPHHFQCLSNRSWTGQGHQITRANQTTITMRTTTANRALVNYGHLVSCSPQIICTGNPDDSASHHGDMRPRLIVCYGHYTIPSRNGSSSCNIISLSAVI